MYEKIITGIVTGLSYGIMGWKSKQKKEDIDFKKLGESVLICAVVGGISGYVNKDISILMTGTVGIATTKIVRILINFGKKIYNNQSVIIWMKK